MLAPVAAAADEDNRSVWVDLGCTLAELTERDVSRLADMAGAPFVRLAHIDDLDVATGRDLIGERGGVISGTAGAER